MENIEKLGASVETYYLSSDKDECDLASEAIDAIMDDLSEKDGVQSAAFDYEASAHDAIVIAGETSGSNPHPFGVAIVPDFALGYRFVNVEENREPGECGIEDVINDFMSKNGSQKKNIIHYIHKALLEGDAQDGVVWNGRKIKAVDKILSQMERGGISGLDISLLRPNQMLIEGRLDNHPFVAAAFPKFGNGVRINTRREEVKKALQDMFRASIPSPALKP